MKNSIKTNQTAGNDPGADASRTIVKFIALLTLLNWAVALHFVRAAEVPGQQQAAQATPIPWNEIGAAAGKQYQGDGLAVAATEEGARLRCVFQRLDGEATREGLWLTSGVEGSQTGRFRVMATAVGQAGEAFGVPASAGGASESFQRFGLTPAEPAKAGTPNHMLPRTGTVEVADKLARFIRPELTEEYSVSMDGVRQDFIIEQRPVGEGPLRVELDVAGAKVEPTAGGARLVLENSGRKIAYGRLRVTDATGKELTAHMEVLQSNSETRKQKAEISQSLLKSDSESRTSPVKSTMEVRKQKAEMASLVVVVNDAEAVYPVRIDPTFSDANWISMGGIPGADSTVHAAVVDGSGSLYIGGEFTLVGDVLANHIAKWNGSSWSALGSGMDGIVLALSVSGSDLYAGGQFTTAGGSAANSIAKWDGSSWTALGSGIDYFVSALAVSGSDVYAGGAFTTAGGIPANYVAKWNGNGWTALGSGMNDQVNALAVSGSNVYAGGYFTTAGGSAATNIAKWNGSSWSALGSGLNEPVRALAVSGSDVYAGGYFTTAGGIAATNIAKWNGSSWSALGSGINGGVSALAVSGSDLYAGGEFTTAGGIAANHIAKWNGSSWSAVGSGMGSRLWDIFRVRVSALAVSGSDVYAGGYFRTTGGSAANHIAKWNGSSWSALGSGMGVFYPHVYALAVSGSDVYAGGYFTTAGGSAATNIAKWNGSSWTALGSGISGDPSYYIAVYALAVSGSDLYAGGGFTTAGGSAATNIAKWNGSSWSALGSGMNGGVGALAVSGSDVYAGGGFTTAGGSVANRIAKWNGSSWSALGSGMGGGNGNPPSVYALAVSGSDLYAGGWFTTAGSSAATNIAKWNGSSWSALGSGMNGGVSALAVSGSDVYAGGGFTTAGDSAATNIAKWNGSSWSPLGSGMGGGIGGNVPFVAALAVSGSDLYAGGGFTTAGGSTANYIAKWDGSSWTGLGSGMGGVTYPSVSALVVSGSDLYAGGAFTTAGGKVSAYIARAYLLTLPALSVLRSGPEVIVSWPSVDTTGFGLEQAGTLAAPAGWVANTASVTDNGTNKSVTVPATNSPQFFRLRRP